MKCCFVDFEIFVEFVEFSFCEVLLLLKNVEEMLVFLYDLCMLVELEVLVDCWWVVLYLFEGVFYCEIYEWIVVSIIMIGWVVWYFNQGSGGYLVVVVWVVWCCMNQKKDKV